MGDPVDPSANLPSGAPANLKAFLECTGAAITFNDGKVPWLSVANLVPDAFKDVGASAAPTVSIESTSPSSATISITIGGVPISSIPVSISNGSLTLDTSGLPDIVGKPLTDQIDNLNAWFKAHGKQLGAPTFGKGRVTLNKVPLTPQAQQVPPGPGASPTGQAKPAAKPPAGWPWLVPAPPVPQQLPPPTLGTVRMSTVASPDAAPIDEIFKVGDGASSKSDSSSRTAPSESAPVRTGSTGGWMGNRRLAGPDDGAEPQQNVAVPGPLDEDAADSTPQPDVEFTVPSGTPETTLTVIDSPTGVVTPGEVTVPGTPSLATQPGQPSSTDPPDLPAHEFTSLLGEWTLWKQFMYKEMLDDEAQFERWLQFANHLSDAHDVLLQHERRLRAEADFRDYILDEYGPDGYQLFFAEPYAGVGSPEGADAYGVSPTGETIQPADGPETGVVPLNEAIPGPVDDAEPAQTPAPSSSRSTRGPLIGVGALVVVAFIAILVASGGGLLASATSTPTPALPGGGPVTLPGFSAGPTGTPRPGGGGTENTAGPGGSTRPVASQPVPPQFVIIATNGFSLTPTNANYCRDGGTMTFLYKIDGIGDTELKVTVTGPAIADGSLTLSVNPDELVTKSFPFPPVHAGGKWTSTITSIGGKAPPSSGSFESTSVDGCP